MRSETLQQRKRLTELLGLATPHLMPQLAGAADLVLLSKLTNMLALGRLVTARASAGTGLEQECEGCGLVAESGDGPAIATTMEGMPDDANARARYGAKARLLAEQRWSRLAILDCLESAPRTCVVTE